MEDNKKVFKFFGRTGEGYQLWAARTKAALCAKDVGDTIEKDVLSEGQVDDAVKKEIATACAIIIQGLGGKPFRLCLSEQNDPYKMRQKLRDRYAVSNTATRVQLQSKLTKLTYTGQVMGDYVDSFEEILNRLAGMDSFVSEDLQVAILLSSFGDLNQSRFGHAISSLQNIQDTLSSETATPRLLQSYDDALWHSESHKSPVHKSADETSQALVASKNYESKRYGKVRVTGRVERRRCYNRREVGHLAKNCPAKGKSGKEKTNRSNKMKFSFDPEHDNDFTMAGAATSLMATIDRKDYERGTPDVERECQCTNHMYSVNGCCPTSGHGVATFDKECMRTEKEYVMLRESEVGNCSAKLGEEARLHTGCSKPSFQVAQKGW